MAGKIPAQFIDELITRVDIVDLINGRVALKKAGKEYQACCPFHDEKTPSFTVSRDKQFYHCFGCGAHGTAIGFLMEYDNMGFVEAVEELARQQGVEVPREGGHAQGPDHRPLHQTLERAAIYYREQLRGHPQAPRAIDYLRQRGLSGEIAREFGIGFAPPGWDNLIRALGGSREQINLLTTAGMLSRRDEQEGRPYDRFRDRIMFPIRNHRGAVIAFGGRILGDGKPKYLNSPETPVFHKGRELYGLYEARKALRDIERLLVVEGYMDVVALAQYGVRHSVATLGTATTAEHLEKLYRTTREVVFCFDGDRAGRAAARKALDTAIPQMRDGREARFMFLPEGEDPDSYVRHHGGERFEQLAARATPLSDFLFQCLSDEIDMDSLGGLARLGEEAKPQLDRLPEGLFKEMMYQRLSQMIGVSSTQLKAAPPPRALRRAPGKGFLGTIPPVRRAIALLLSNPRLALCEDLPVAWQRLDLPGITLLTELLELLKAQPNLTTAAVLERWRERPEGRHLQKLAGMLLDLPGEGLAVEFEETLRSLTGRDLDLELEQLLEKSRTIALTDTEKAQLKQLLERKSRRATHHDPMEKT
ncbi:MAG: DNA primase [gamma proteobacterium symbiont of Phacoides pectinatus]